MAGAKISKMQSLAECLLLLDPQNHEQWRFYTPNIWVITPKNEGNLGSHGKMFIDVIYVYFFQMASWCHEDNPVDTGIHTRRGLRFQFLKSVVEAVCIACCINA